MDRAARRVRRTPRPGSRPASRPASTGTTSPSIPGIGFAKTVAHNRGDPAPAALFPASATGPASGVSRKGFIGALSGRSRSAERAAGRVARRRALAGAGAGAQSCAFTMSRDDRCRLCRVWHVLSARDAMPCVRNGRHIASFHTRLGTTAMVRDMTHDTEAVRHRRHPRHGQPIR